MAKSKTLTAPNAGEDVEQWWWFSHSVVSDSCDPIDCSLPGSSLHGVFSGKNTGVGCHFLLQGIFLDQRLNPHLLHWQGDSLPLNHLGSPYYDQTLISGTVVNSSCIHLFSYTVLLGTSVSYKYCPCRGSSCYISGDASDKVIRNTLLIRWRQNSWMIRFRNRFQVLPDL